MAVTEERIPIVYEVEVKGGDEAKDRLAKIYGELERLREVLGARPTDFAKEYAKSFDWLATAMDRASKAGHAFSSDYNKVYLAMHKTSTEAANLAGETGKVEVETKKAGKGFDLGGTKMLKFAGAIGLGVYSMYSFASKVRQALRAVLSFIKDGIERAIEKNKELALLVDTEVNKKLERTRDIFAKELTPGIAEAAGAIGQLLDTLEETGAIEAFGNTLGAVIAGAARGMGVLVRLTSDLIDLLDQIKIPETGEIDYGLPEETATGIEKWGTRGLAAAGYAAIPFAGPMGVATGGVFTGKAIVDELTGAAPVAELPRRVGYDKVAGQRRRKKKPRAGGRGKKPYGGPFGATYEMDVYTKTAQARIAAEEEEWRDIEAAGGRADKALVAGVGLNAENMKKMHRAAIDDAKVKGAYVKTFGDALASAAQSGDFGQALKQQAIAMGATIATALQW
jgi:hypothetical protein